jgi:hypothetical protein
MRVHFRLIKTKGAAPQVLSFVKRDIGGFQQLVEFAGVVRRDGNADADVDHHAIAIKIERLVNRFTDPRGEHGGIPVLIKRSLNDGKFIAAEAGDQIHISDAAAQAARYGLDQLVTSRVAESVVNALQMIEVEVSDRQPLSPSDALECLFELQVKKLAIRQAGQRVMVREMHDPLFRGFCLGDIFVGGDPSAALNRLADDVNDPPVTKVRRPAEDLSLVDGSQNVGDILLDVVRAETADRRSMFDDFLQGGTRPDDSRDKPYISR